VNLPHYSTTSVTYNGKYGSYHKLSKNWGSSIPINKNTFNSIVNKIPVFNIQNGKLCVTNQPN
jgi:hypothetical protein